MADNTVIASMSGGDTIASDDIATGVAAGAKVQRVKVGYGADGSYSDATSSAGLPVALVAPSTVGAAKASVATAGTRVQLGNHACLSVTVKAKPGNAGLIYLGDSTVAASNGFDLNPGESLSMDIPNTNLLYVDAAINGDGISYLWVA